MKKFDERNVIKKKIHKKKTTIIIETKEIWFVDLGCNVGNEQDGNKGFKRPVLVIRRIGSLYFSIPLTSVEKEGKFYYKIKSFQEGNVISRLILSQGKVLDKNRFIRQIGKIENTEFIHIKKLLKEMYLGKVF